MNSWQLKNGYTVFQLLNGRSNVYLVHTGRIYILVDTGISWVRHKLMAQLTALGVPGDQLKYLILTHTHFDHCGNAGYIFHRFKPSIIVHSLESAFLENGFAPLPKGANMVTGTMSKLGMLLKPLFKFQRTKADILVKDTLDMYPLGIDIELIHTPGHSKGSISLIVNHELALVGDALFGIFPVSVVPPLYDDRKLLIESFKKLLMQNCRLYLPGHGHEITYERLKTQYNQHTLQH